MMMVMLMMMLMMQLLFHSSVVRLKNAVIGIWIRGTDILRGVGWGNFVCSMLLGYVYPAYECFKIVERKKPELEHLRFWCQYWYYIFNTIKFLCRRYLGFEVSKSVGLSVDNELEIIALLSVTENTML
jgi:hypothetical protein